MMLMNTTRWISMLVVFASVPSCDLMAQTSTVVEVYGLKPTKPIYGPSDSLRGIEEQARKSVIAEWVKYQQELKNNQTEYSECLAKSKRNDDTFAIAFQE